MSKNQQLQIRISPEDKTRIQERAASAGMDVSKWVLNMVLPPDLLDRLTGKEFEQAVHHEPEVSLPSFEANYLAAMIESAAMLKGAVPPGWTAAVPALERPWFASALRSLRLYLLTNSPPPFRRRNLFVDNSVGRRI